MISRRAVPVMAYLDHDLLLPIDDPVLGDPRLHIEAALLSEVAIARAARKHLDHENGDRGVRPSRTERLGPNHEIRFGALATDLYDRPGMVDETEAVGDDERDEERGQSRYDGLVRFRRRRCHEQLAGE
jgi:hypothetical protein